MKRARKAISILVTLTMLIGLLLPAGGAFAASNYSAIRVQTNINDDSVASLATVKMEFPAGALEAGDSVLISLPEDFQFVAALGAGNKDNIQAAAAFTAGGPNVFAIPASNGSDLNGLFAGPDGVAGSGGDDAAIALAVTVLDDNEIRLSIPAGAVIDASQKAFINFTLGAVYVPSGEGKDIVLTFEPGANSGFVAGEVVVGKTSGGNVTMRATNTQTGNNIFDVTVRIKEDVVGSLEARTDSFKITLPDGYEWVTNPIQDADAVTPGLQAGTHLSGDDIVQNIAQADFTVDEDLISFSPAAGGAFVESTVNPSQFSITLRFEVADESKVKGGDIVAKVSGKSTIGTTEMVVGTYGDFGATITAESKTPVIFAGLEEQEVADITIKEAIAGSLLEGRTITLELPAGARWQHQQNNAANIPDNSDRDNGLQVQGTSYTGTDSRIAKYTVDVQGAATLTTSAAEVSIEDLEVMVEPGFTGDLVVKVSGSAGLTGELLLAKVVAPVQISVDTKTVVSIGKSAQALGTIIVAETSAGALDDATLTLRLPSGTKWDKIPTVEVIEGDLKLESTVTRASAVAGAGDNRDLQIVVDRSSDKASKIKISGVKIAVDRTVAEGDIKVDVRGAAAINLTPNPWPNTTNAASTVVAVVGTPAPDSGSVIFNIGSTVYTASGVTKVMDAAPYIKDSRTYVPVRYMALAMGVAESDIAFENGVVTLKKGDVTLKLTIGDKTLMNNDAAVAMDVAPEIVNGRTMLPARFVAEGFGAMVGFANGQVVISY